MSIPPQSLKDHEKRSSLNCVTQAQRSIAEQFRHLLKKIRQQKLTGRASLICPPHRWFLFFELGHCVYATGSYHRIRRWNRALHVTVPEFQVSSPQAPLQQPWELHILKTAIQQDDLMIDEGLAIAMVSLREVLFAIISSPEISWNWQSTTPLNSASDLGLRLDHDKVEAILDETIRLHRQWTSLGLDLHHVNSAPVIQEKPNEPLHKLSSFSSVHELLTGKHSFWDLALISPMPLAVTTRLLHHFSQQGILSFQFLPDLAPPTYLLNHLKAPPVLVESEAPLIACIDDSLQVCHLMEIIVTGAGYRFLGITDSLQALPELMEKKPQFIFLDLVMPVVGGYELCKQLRRVKAFELTPITILTSRSGMIPRLKSNMVGATHFINKPFDPDFLLALLNQYFEDNQGEVSALTEMAVETAIDAERVSSQTHVA